MADKSKEKAKKGSELKESKPAGSVLPYEDIDRLFDEFLSRNWLSPFRLNLPGESTLRTTLATKLPNVDVIDRDNEIIIRAEIPGIDKKDLEVTMTNNTLTIKGETRKEQKEEKEDYYRREISRGSISRVVSLPCDVDCEKAKSSYENGMLEVVAPKAKTVKQHKIKI